jgi:hypothetical protein
MDLLWEEQTRENFEKLIGKVPAVMRGFARDKVSKKIDELLKKSGGGVVTEKIMVDAFFEATPFGFHGPMKTDMETIGLDYTKYGHQR